MVFAKTPQAISMENIPYSHSFQVYGLISPYPTVAIVVKDQYKEVKYFTPNVSSYMPALIIQPLPEEPSS